VAVVSAVALPVRPCVLPLPRVRQENMVQDRRTQRQYTYSAHCFYCTNTFSSKCSSTGRWHSDTWPSSQTAVLVHPSTRAAAATAYVKARICNLTRNQNLISVLARLRTVYQPLEMLRCSAAPAAAPRQGYPWQNVKVGVDLALLLV
jgi:hypothetical protein